MEINFNYLIRGKKYLFCCSDQHYKFESLKIFLIWVIGFMHCLISDCQDQKPKRFCSKVDCTKKRKAKKCMKTCGLCEESEGMFNDILYRSFLKTIVCLLQYIKYCQHSMTGIMKSRSSYLKRLNNKELTSRPVGLSFHGSDALSLS